MLQDLTLDNGAGRRRSQSPRPLSPSRLRQWRDRGGSCDGDGCGRGPAPRQDASQQRPPGLQLSVHTPRPPWLPDAVGPDASSLATADAANNAQTPERREPGLPLMPSAAALASRQEAASAPVTEPGVPSVAAAAARLEARDGADSDRRGRSAQQQFRRQAIRSKSVGGHLCRPLSPPRTPPSLQLPPDVQVQAPC